MQRIKQIPNFSSYRYYLIPSYEKQTHWYFALAINVSITASFGGASLPATIQFALIGTSNACPKNPSNDVESRSASSFTAIRA